MDVLPECSQKQGKYGRRKTDFQEMDLPCKKQCIDFKTKKLTDVKKTEEKLKYSMVTRQQKKLDENSVKPGTGDIKLEFPNQKLPYEILVILFSFLSIPNLVTVQRVCSGWRAAAQDTSLWKNFVLTLYGTPEDKRKLMTMPAVRNIAGEVGNNFVNVIFKHVRDLSKLTCQFIPPLSSSQIRTVMRKFPKLEALTLDVSESSILESLEMVKTSDHIKEIYFTLYYNRRNSKHKSPSRLTNVLSVFNHAENFSRLTNIDISDKHIWLSAANEPTFVNVLINIIIQKSQQLLSLKVIIRSNVESENFIKAVNMCTNLQILYIELIDPFNHSVCLDIEKMTQLRSLHVQITNVTNYLPIFCGFLYNGSSTCLRKLEITAPAHQVTFHMLGAIILNYKDLRELTVRDTLENISEVDLKDIGSLTKLKKLVVDGLTSFSKEGLNYLSECKNLTYLVIHASASTITNWNSLIANMINQMKELDTLIFSINDHYVILARRVEIEEFISENLTDNP